MPSYGRPRWLHSTTQSPPPPSYTSLVTLCKGRALWSMAPAPHMRRLPWHSWHCSCFCFTDGIVPSVVNIVLLHVGTRRGLRLERFSSSPSRATYRRSLPGRELGFLASKNALWTYPIKY